MGKFDEIFDDVVVNAKACASAVSQKASTVYELYGRIEGSAET